MRRITIFTPRHSPIGYVGNVEAELAGLPKSALAKRGDLRYNTHLFFYQKGRKIALAKMRNITAVNERIEDRTRQPKKYGVCVSIGYEKVYIDTKECNMAALKEDILEKRRQARY